MPATPSRVCRSFRFELRAVRSKEPSAFSGWPKQGADEPLKFEVEFYDHTVGAAGQAEAGSDVIFEPVRQFAPDYRKDIVLLCLERI